MLSDGARLTWWCALAVVVTVAAVVSGKPHHRGCPGAATPLQDDYARALMALQYYPGAQPAAAEQPEYEAAAIVKAPCSRSGRSNGGPPSDGPAVVPHHVVEQATAPPPPPSIAAAVKSAAPLGPCKGPSPPATGQAAANETVAAPAPVDKLTAYYDRLKAQQEQLARHQLEQQLLEQQRQRHRDYALVQQQIQQQYYQQQQHSLLMLDQLHKNPAFVSQLAAYMDQRLKANNGTAAPVAPVPAAPEVPPVVPAEATKVVDQGGDAGVMDARRSDFGRSAEEKDQDIARHVHDKDDGEGCDLPAKRVEPRQAVAGDRSCEFTDDDDDDEAQDRSEDDPIVEKVYSMITK